MPYNNNIPQAADILSNSQGSILANFQAIQALIDYDHVPFNGLGQGKHNKITLPVQPVVPVFGADNGFYNAVSAITGIAEIYATHHILAGAVNSAITASSRSFQAPVQGDRGWTNLASGIKLRWDKTGVIPAGANTAVVIPVVAHYPAFATIFAVMPYVIDNTGIAIHPTVKLVSIDSNLQFTVNTSVNTVVGYLVIGV